MDISGLSFFRHDDFNFEDKSADQIDSDSKPNRMEIKLYNSTVKQGRFIAGMSVVFLRQNLPEGHIHARINTYLKSRLRSDIPSLNYRDLINKFHSEYPVVKTPRTVARSKDELLAKYSHKTEKMKKNRPTHQFSKKIIGDNIELARTNRVFEMSDINKRQNLKNIRNRPSVFVQQNSRIDVDGLMSNSQRLVQNPLYSISNAPQEAMHYIDKTELILSKDIRIFSFLYGAKSTSSYIIPFEIRIPEDYPISYKHRLNLGMGVNLLRRRARNSFHLGKNGSHKGATLTEIEGGLKEEIELKHTLTLYFISNKALNDHKLTSNDQINISDSNNSSIFKKECTFKIFSHDNHIFHERYLKKIDSIIERATIPRLSMSCFNCFRRSKVGQSARSIDNNIYISIDKLVYRKSEGASSTLSDNSINCVIQYPNEILSLYDYIDIALIARYCIDETCHQTEKILLSKNSNRGLIEKDSLRIFSAQKSMNYIEYNKSIKTQLSKLPSPSREDSGFPEIIAKGSDTVHDVIIEVSTIDLLGKRVIDSNKRTEIVHRIDLKSIMMPLETVTTKNIKIGYSLMFYLSVGPMGFTKEIDKVPIVFQTIPNDHKTFTKMDAIIKYRELNSRAEQINDPNSDNFQEEVMILPYTRIEIDEQNEKTNKLE